MSHRADSLLILIETVRGACLNAAMLAYEDAGIRGLCPDGRWEVAMAAIRHLDLSALLEHPPGSPRIDDDPAVTTLRLRT